MLIIILASSLVAVKLLVRFRVVNQDLSGGECFPVGERLLVVAHHVDIFLHTFSVQLPEGATTEGREANTENCPHVAIAWRLDDVVLKTECCFIDELAKSALLDL